MFITTDLRPTMPYHPPEGKALTSTENWGDGMKASIEINIRLTIGEKVNPGC